MKREAGFTLLEMLVALAVFGVLAMATAELLGAGIASREAMTRADARLAALSDARAMLTGDLAQIALRTTREESGAQRPWRFFGRDPGRAGAAASREPMLVLLRRGRSNPGGAGAHGGLLLVDYALEDGTLVRRVRHRPDQAPGTPATRHELLTGVSGAGLRFLGADGRWREDWQVPARGGPAPRAVELTLEIAGLGSVRQVFMAGGA